MKWIDMPIEGWCGRGAWLGAWKVFLRRALLFLFFVLFVFSFGGGSFVYGEVIHLGKKNFEVDRQRHALYFVNGEHKVRVKLGDVVWDRGVRRVKYVRVKELNLDEETLDELWKRLGLPDRHERLWRSWR